MGALHAEKARALCEGASAVPEWTAALRRLEARLGSGMVAALIGPRGVGKTQAAASLIRTAISRAAAQITSVWGLPGNKPVAICIRAVDLMRRLKAGFDTEREASFDDVLAHYERASLLCIDELAELAGSAWERQVLTGLVDARYSARKDTLALANATSQQLSELVGTSIASRMLECGGIIETNWPSFRGNA